MRQILKVFPEIRRKKGFLKENNYKKYIKKFCTNEIRRGVRFLIFFQPHVEKKG